MGPTITLDALEHWRQPGSASCSFEARLRFQRQPTLLFACLASCPCPNGQAPHQRQEPCVPLVPTRITLAQLDLLVTRQRVKTNLSHDGLNPAHVPFQRVNNPTLALVCGGRIGRADIEESKSAVDEDSHAPQASYPYGNLSGTSGDEVCPRRGSIGHAFAAPRAPDTRRQGGLYPFVQPWGSRPSEPPIGHSCYHFRCIPPQVSSPFSAVCSRSRGTACPRGDNKVPPAWRGSAADRQPRSRARSPYCMSKAFFAARVFQSQTLKATRAPKGPPLRKERLPSSLHPQKRLANTKLEPSSTGSSCPSDMAGPVPPAVASLERRWGQWGPRSSIHARP